MKKLCLMLAVALGGIQVGCDRSEPAPPPAPKQPAGVFDGVKAAADKAADDAKAAADRSAADAKAAADKSAADARAAADKASDAAAADKAAADARVNAAKATADKAASDARGMADGAATQPASSSANVDAAKSLLAQLFQYIKDNKLVDADATLKKLDDMKASLPASMSKQIDDAHKALAAKKAASGDVGGVLNGLR